MLTAKDVIRNEMESMEAIASPLASDWETVLFAAVQDLYHLKKEFWVEEDVAKQLLPILQSGTPDMEALNGAIQTIQNSMMLHEEKFIREKVKNVLRKLFAVKATWNQ